jgi:hypothetical protein
MSGNGGLDNVRGDLNLSGASTTGIEHLTTSSTSSVSRGLSARKQAFRLALVRKGWSGATFANLHGVSRQVLWAVLDGTDSSARLDKAIDRFIAKSEQKDEP